MKHFICIIFLTLAITAGAEDITSGLRSDALSLLQSLQTAEAASSFPEEYQSFTATIDAAEELQSRENSADAERLFSLAILKGKILRQRTNEPAVSVATKNSHSSKTVFTTISSLSPQLLRQATEANKTATYSVTTEDANAGKIISARIVGGEGIYTVRKGDSLRLISSRLGVRLRDLAIMNRLQRDAILTPGQKLKYNNRRIVPKTIKNGIVVNIPDRNLYLFRNGRIFAHYPVALGISKKKESIIWRTPVGKFQIIDKKENPSWRIPLSIQKEMEENGDEVLEVVPPGPKNPLGKYAMRTTLAGILIHSTTRPASINSYSSHGCIRVMPEHMERLFKSVSVPMQGEIIYQPVKIEVTAAGKVFLEVNNDSYEKVADLSAEVRKIINKKRAEKIVSWQRINKMITEKSGIAEDVTLPEMPD